MKLCVIAGGGNLPKDIITETAQKNIPTFLITISTQAEPEFFFAIKDKIEDQIDLDIGKVGKALEFCKKNGVTHLVFAGSVERPNLSSVSPDFEGVNLLGRILTNKFLGDDNILKCVLRFFEEKSYKILSTAEIMNSGLTPFRDITDSKPSAKALLDIEIGVKALAQMSNLDIGQALIVSSGKIIAVEASEGTDEMIKRSKDYVLEQAVLVKLPKIGQDQRIDMPTIGTKTIDMAAKSNINGIAIDQNVIIVSPEETIARANESKIYIHIIKSE